jgi:chlorite dismutase
MADRMQAESGEPRRQVVNFAFFKALPDWRRLPPQQKQELRREFAGVIGKWRDSEQMKVISYSLAGLRADCDMMLWRICYSLDCLQQMHAELMTTRLGSYLATPYSYLAMTRHSQYQIGHGHEHMERGVLKCGVAKYACIHPFMKTRAWYQLPFEERQRIVRDYINVARDFPRVRLNTTFSFGLDDQEFVLAFESDHPADFVDLVMRLRETENSLYTTDTPLFTCLQCSVDEMLERLG